MDRLLLELYFWESSFSANILSIYREKEIGNALNGETKVDIFKVKEEVCEKRLVVCIIYNVKKLIPFS